MAKNKRGVGVIDSETDPFLYGRIPEPFVWGYCSDDHGFIYFWGKPKDCTEKMAEFLRERDEIVYAHNGGRFDFFFLIPYIDNGSIKIINGRIAECRIGKCTLRDSMLILPLGLANYKKDDIDYQLMEKKVRHKHKNEIIKYLKGDCEYLHEWVSKFLDRFGRKLTLASAAMSELKKTDYPVTMSGKSYDSIFRPFYFGGRCEAIKYGVIEGKKKVVDINSAYPYAMMSKHPHGNSVMEIYYLPDDSNYFAIIEAISIGCLIRRQDDGKKVTYDRDGIARVYHVTGWEIQAGLDTGTLEIIKVIKVYRHDFNMNFNEYVTKFYEEKKAAKKSGDKDNELFSKLMLNSCYGKFGSNPFAFKDYEMTDLGDIPDDYYDKDGKPQWFLNGDIMAKSIWERRTRTGINKYYNVATAASITGFVRAYLFRAMQQSEDVIYCDTDSIICSVFNGEIGDKLGEWDDEGTVLKAYVGGRKLYAMEMEDGKFKTASKGARLTAEEIVRLVSTDGEILWKNEAPTFSLNGIDFINRTIRMVK